MATRDPRVVEFALREAIFGKGENRGRKSYKVRQARFSNRGRVIERQTIGGSSHQKTTSLGSGGKRQGGAKDKGRHYVDGGRQPRPCERRCNHCDGGTKTSAL